MSCRSQFTRSFGWVALWFLLPLSTAFPAPGSDSPDYLLQAWQSEDGLPHQVINSVLQDNQGFIWLATETALVRFDGRNFREFTSSLIGNEKSSRIRALVQEDDSTLLMAPDFGGLVRLRNGTFEPHPASVVLGNEPVAALFTERSGAVWVGYLRGDVVRWENGRLESFGNREGLRGQWSSWSYDNAGDLWFANSGFLGRFANGELIRLDENLGDRLCIATRRRGGLWIASNERLCLLENGQVTRLIESPPWAGAARVRTLFEDRSGNLWIGTSARGLYRFGQGKLTQVATSHPAIHWVREDYEGNLWVATQGGGLNRLRSRIFDLYNSRQGLPDDISYSVSEDAEGRLWVGNSSGGLLRFRGEQFEILTELSGWPELRVFSITTDLRNDAWIGTRTGLYFWKTGSAEPPRQMADDVIRDVHVLFPSSNGDVWVAADPDVFGRFRDGVFTRFDAARGFSGEAVRAVAESMTGDLWIGTEAGELFRRRDGKFEKFTTAQGLPGSAIRTICIDPEGVVWIGTSGGGLVVWANEKFSRVTSANGLPVNAIFQILLDERGRMWFGSPAGLFHVTREALLACVRGNDQRFHAVMFGRSDGLESVSCLSGFQPGAARSAKGELWFATRQGLLKVDTAAEKINRRPPPVLLNECVADNRLLDPAKAFRVPSDVRKLQFRFAVLSYTAPEKVQVRHRLDGFDSEWVEAGSERQVTYPKLPPGNYRLRVAACNNDGVWNEKGLDLSFVVLPAWWQTGWFRILTVIGFAVIIGLSVRYWSHRRLRLKLMLLEHQQALEKERARIARDLHDDLGVSLTQIALLAEMSVDNRLPPDRLKRNLGQVSTGARNLVRELDGILWTVNPKNDSLDQLASYLCQFSQQFFRLTPICCRFDVGENIPSFPLSPEVRHDLFLIVKEAINNVVKHSGATEVWLRLHAAREAFHITIEDNGRGLSPGTLQNSGRNGISNMRTRTEGLGGVFEIQSHLGGGTTLQIHFPLKPQSTAFIPNGS